MRADCRKNGRLRKYHYSKIQNAGDCVARTGVREIGFKFGSLPHDPGGITCMRQSSNRYETYQTGFQFEGLIPSPLFISLKRNTGEYLIYNFTDLGIVQIAIKRFHCTTCKMTGKRVHNVLEIRAYIRGRMQHGLKPLDIHCEVCDIYWDTVIVL